MGRWRSPGAGGGGGDGGSRWWTRWRWRRSTRPRRSGGCRCRYTCCGRSRTCTWARRGTLEEAIRHGWVMWMNSASAAREVRGSRGPMAAPALVQVAVDTGMSRAGVAVDEFDAVAAAVTGEESLRLVGLSTHFVAAEDASSPLTGEQLAAFRQATDAIAAGSPAVVRHVGNSGGVFLHPASHLDMVPPGQGDLRDRPGGRGRRWVGICGQCSSGSRRSMMVRKLARADGRVSGGVSPRATTCSSGSCRWGSRTATRGASRTRA